MQTLPLTLTYTYTNTSTHTSTYTHTYTYQGIERKQAGKGFSLLAWQNSEEKKRFVAFPAEFIPQESTSFMSTETFASRCSQMLAIVAHSTGSLVPEKGNTTAWTTTYLPGRVVVAWPGTRHHINQGEWLMMQTIESQICQYCLGPVFIGEADEPMMQNACSVAVKVGLVCARCGYVGQNGERNRTQPNASNLLAP